MLSKKSLISILIIFTLCIGSVCIVCADSGTGTFKELAKEVSGDKTGTITLTKNYANTDGYDSDGIEITSDNLVIKGEEGKDITIDAQYAGRVFNANGTKNVTFENINFINGNCSDAGGALLLGEEASNSAKNCHFSNCYSDSFGGAIDGNAIGCQFDGCSANYHGGAIFDGSAINCTFNSCFSQSCGGAISYHNATNCKFVDCYAWWRGGALYEADAVGCNFTNIYASEGGSMYKGDAFNCDFQDSIAKNGSGGAIYEGSAKGCSFSGCSVINGEGNAMFGGTATDCEIDKADTSGVTIK